VLRDRVREGAGRDPNPSAAVLDSQSILTSEGGPQRGFDMGKRTRGRKRRLVVDTMVLVLVLVLMVMVTSASVQDRAGGKATLERLAAGFTTIGLVWADGGYANKALLAWTEQTLGIVLEIIKRADDVHGFQVLPRRWVVERTFGWLIRNRRLARDYERRPDNSETMIHIAMIHLMAKRLTGERTIWSNRTP
jgi:transposase